MGTLTLTVTVTMALAHQQATTPALALALATSAKTHSKVMEPIGMMQMASTTIANGTDHTMITATGTEMTMRASWMVSPPAKLAAHVVVVLPQMSCSSRPRQKLRAQSWQSHLRGSLC